MPTLLQRPGFAGALAHFWHTSYASDYVGLLFILIIDGLIQTYVLPFHRRWRPDSIPLHYPYTEHERVSVTWLFIFALGVPSLVFFVWAVAFRPSLHKINVTYLGLLTSIILTVFVTDVVKNSVGRPRPDLRARCRPHKDTPGGQQVMEDICDETNPHKLHDGWRSFPSGHSAFSFAGLGFLTLFFAAQFHIVHPGSSLPTVLLTLAPLFGAMLIAISRLQDYRHDYYDVIAGAVLGFSIAWMTYRRFYPPLKSSWCDTPYPSKSEMMSGTAAKWHPRKERDEEARLGFRASDTSIGGSPKNGNASREESEDEVDKGLLRPPTSGR